MEVTFINIGDIVAYGMRCLSSQLKAHGFTVNLVFVPMRYTDITHPALFPALEALTASSAFIGISLMYGQLAGSIAVTHYLKTVSGAPIIWGGIHPMIAPEECIRYADIVCLGEGEDTVLELATRMRDGQSYDTVQGLWIKKSNGEVIKNAFRPIPVNLDQYPPQDQAFERHFIFDYDKGCLCPMDEAHFLQQRGPRYTTLPTRGCGMNCTYCVNNFLHTLDRQYRVLRSRSVDHVIQELRWVKEHMPFIQEINFYDDDFLRLPMAYIREFADRYARDIALPLAIFGIAPHSFNAEKLEYCRSKITLTRFRLGIQSGSERVRRDVFHRRQSNADLMNIMTYFATHGAGMKIYYDIIIGNPWETEEDLADGFRFLMQIPRPFVIMFYQLGFFPGTELYERARREGVVTIDNDGTRAIRCDSFRRATRMEKILLGIGILPPWFLWTVFWMRTVPLVGDVLLALLMVMRAYKRRRRWLRLFRRSPKTTTTTGTACAA